MGTTAIEKAAVIIPTGLIEYLAPAGRYEIERAKLRDDFRPVVESSKKITSVSTPEEAEELTQHGRLLQACSKEIEAFYKPIKQKIDSVKRPILDSENADIKEVESEKARLGVISTAYKQRVRREAEEAQRKAEEEARQQAEKDALERAMLAAAMGDDDVADSILEEPVVAAPVVLMSTPEKPKGDVDRKTYRARVANLMELVKAVADGRVLLEALSANESWLNKKADNEKEGFHVPGVELIITESTTFRS